MHILLAVDETPFSRLAIDRVVERFRPERVTVHVLHVMQWATVVPTSFCFGRGGSYAPQIEAALETGRRQALELASSVAQTLQAAGFRTTAAVREGDPETEILACEKDIHPDLIVMGSHHRTGFDHFLLGSVSEAVSRRSHCAVEVVRQLH